MAFHQPTARHSLPRPLIEASTAEREVEAQANARGISSPQGAAGVEESQTWVLFSPVADDATTTSYLSSVREPQSQQTPGRSRASDLGSLNTLARSDLNSAPVNSANSAAVASALPRFLSREEEEDAELDVLDSHLPEFRSSPCNNNNNNKNKNNSNSDEEGNQRHLQSLHVLPTHDGLGSFRLDTIGLGTDLQEHIYAFERYNPRRVKRRRESLDLAQLEPESEQAQEAERNRRIEAWRQEQSQMLLEAITKETRRRRQSEASAQHQQHRQQQRVAAATATATHSFLAEVAPIDDSHMAGTEWHEQDAASSRRDHREAEGLWSRITRKVIRDLMGIDDRLLAILFGESESEDEDLSSTPKASSGPGGLAEKEQLESQGHDSSWRLRMLERIARELGLLVHHISTHHPGAFATYSRLQQMPLPYAGLPVIHEADTATTTSALHVPLERTGGVEDTMMMTPQFKPSAPQLQPQERSGLPLHQTQPVAFTSQTRDSPAVGDTTTTTIAPEADPGTFTQEEWEQDLDIKLVFRYLRSRFASSSSTSSSTTSPSPTPRPGAQAVSISASQDAAARVRLHHPLLGRGTPRRAVVHAAPGATSVSSPAGPSVVNAGVHHHHHGLHHHHTRHRSTSCASQSTRRTRRSSMSTVSRHSSRHYWDIGGSVGAAGGVIASTGPMGSWGEV